MENRFINRETLGFLEAQEKADDRTDVMEVKIREVVQFLYDYEQYNDEQVKNLATQIELIDQAQKVLKTDQLQITNALFRSLEDKQSQIRIAFITALSAIALTITVGVMLWVLK